MPVDFYANPLESKVGVKPQKVVITIDCTKDGVCPFWQAEVGAQLDILAKCMLSDRRIPKVVKDDLGKVIGSIEIT